MGISMAICELDSDRSSCKAAKLKILKVNLKNVAGYESCAEFDLIVPMEEAKKLFASDLEGFLKRNRFDGEAETIYMEKVKNDNDRAKLLPVAKKNYTGWIVMDKADVATRQKVLDLADPDERMTEWEMLSFEEMGATCKKCELSWDEGRGCIGTFGPETSGLPDIARKNGLTIVASVPDAVKNKTKFKVEEAKLLLEEVKVLREKLPDEGKMAVRRYSGVLDRLEKTANLSLKYGVRFYFI
jgi:hypothetical protein